MENIICAETPATVYVPMSTLGLLHDHKQEREGHHYTFMIHTDTLHDHGTSGREKQAKSHGDFGGVFSTIHQVPYLALVRNAVDASSGQDNTCSIPLGTFLLCSTYLPI